MKKKLKQMTTYIIYFYINEYKYENKNTENMYLSINEIINSICKINLNSLVN